MKKMNNKGFTLAELLIVVAIIAVLVAIAIPVFTTQLEKAREATDVANVRSAYGAAVSQYLSQTTPAPISVTVKATQTIAGWQNGDGGHMYLSTNIGSFAKQVEITNHVANDNFTVNVKSDGTVTVD